MIISERRSFLLALGCVVEIYTVFTRISAAPGARKYFFVCLSVLLCLFLFISCLFVFLRSFQFCLFVCLSICLLISLLYFGCPLVFLSFFLVRLFFVPKSLFAAFVLFVGLSRSFKLPCFPPYHYSSRKQNLHRLRQQAASNSVSVRPK